MATEKAMSEKEKAIAESGILCAWGGPTPSHGCACANCTGVLTLWERGFAAGREAGKCAQCGEPNPEDEHIPWGEKDYCSDCWPGYNLCKRCENYRCEHKGGKGECMVSDSNCPEFVEDCETRTVTKQEFRSLVSHWEGREIKRLCAAATSARDMLAKIRGWTKTYKELRAALKPFLEAPERVAAGEEKGEK